MSKSVVLTNESGESLYPVTTTDSVYGEDGTKTLNDILRDKQPNITETNKLSSDLISDTDSANMFMTQAEKTKLSGIEDGANKVTKTSQLTNDSGFMTGYTETDPTVPSWAKQATKPTYTASEVGALPSSTVYVSSVNGMTGAVTGLAKTSDIPDTSNFVTTNTAQTITGSKAFTGQVGNMQTEAGVYLGLDANGSQPNANIAITSANTAAYIDMGRPNVDYDFRIIKWNTADNKHAQLVYGGNASGTITIPQAYGTMALTSDLANYFPLSGGAIGANGIQWGDASLPQDTAPQFICTIDAFAAGGRQKWASLADLKAQLGVPSLLSAFPVGAVYLSIVEISPASFLGGSWTKLPAGYALWTSPQGGAGSMIAAGVPNITGKQWLVGAGNTGLYLRDHNEAGVFGRSEALTNHVNGGSTGGANTWRLLTFDASKSNSIYGMSETVQPPAYKVYAWRRTA